MNGQEPTFCPHCGNHDCRRDADGWCPTHSWGCADFHLYLRDEGIAS